MLFKKKSRHQPSATYTIWHTMLEPKVQCKKWNISYCALYTKCTILSFDGWTIWPCQPALVWNCWTDGWSPLPGCSQSALPWPCIVHFVGNLGHSKWDYWRWWKKCVIYQNICFWWNCLYVANAMEFITAKNRPGQERLANLLFSLVSSGWKTCSKKGIKQSEMQSE